MEQHASMPVKNNESQEAVGMGLVLSTTETLQGHSSAQPPPGPESILQRGSRYSGQ